MKAKEFIPPSRPRNFVAKNQKTAGAGAHKDKKRSEKQGDVKHKKDLVPMEDISETSRIMIPKGMYNDDEFYAYDPETMELKRNWSNKERSAMFHKQDAEEAGWTIKKGSHFNYGEEKLFRKQ
jgi:hypothetical protein